MQKLLVKSFDLKPFDFDTLGVKSVRVEMDWSQDYLQLTYKVRGDFRCVQWSKRNSGGEREDRLWENTCFEFFLRPNAGLSYREFNFSPSGNWNGFQFTKYRTQSEGGFESFRPLVHCRMGVVERQLKVVLARCGWLNAGVGAQIQLATIIRMNDGEFQYWALEHAKNRPDFHDFRTFKQLGI